MRRIMVATAALGVLATSLIVLGAKAQPEIEAQPEPGSSTVKATEQEATREARASGRRIEVASGRGAQASVYANPNGTFSREHYVEPIRVMQNGKWVPIDTTIVTYSNGAIGPKATAMPVWFSGGGADVPLATVNMLGRKMSIAWPGALPKPTINGSRATYHNVLPDVDLVVNATKQAFSHVLVVKTREAAQSPALANVAFRLQTAQLKLGIENGRLVARDAGRSGKVFEAPQPLMWDSGKGALPGEDLKPTLYAPESARVAPIQTRIRGDQMVLTPDKAMLTDPSVNFPLYIDPIWHPSPVNNAYTMIDSGYPYEEYWSWRGKSDERVGFCPRDTSSDCNNSQKKRVLFQIPTGDYIHDNIEIISANFRVNVKHVENTSNAHDTQLWLTGGIDSGTNWTYQPTWMNQVGVWSEEGTRACDSTDRNASMDATYALQQARANKWSNTTFGLLSNVESSSTPTNYRGNRRFCHDAFVSVNYNRKPTAPTNLSYNPGGACVSGASRPYTSSLPSLSATVGDPDNATWNGSQWVGHAEPVSAEFEVRWTPSGGTEQTRTIERSGKYAGASYDWYLGDAGGIPEIPENVVVKWRVRGSDGVINGNKSWGPHAPSASTWCEFIYNKSKPFGVDIDSAQYLPDDSADNANELDFWKCNESLGYLDGVGNYGSFTFKSRAGDTDVTKYKYGINTSPNQEVAAGSGTGKPATIRWAPTAEGVYTINVRPVDVAGNESETTSSCRVKIGPGRAPVGAWKFNDPQGSTQANNSINNNTYPAIGGTGIQFGVDGPDGIVGGAVYVNGTSNGFLQANSIGLVDTSQPFSVSTWAWADNPTSGTQQVVSQDGTGEAGFTLGLDGGKWTLRVPYMDANGHNAGSWALFGPAATAKQWTHLIASFDPHTDKLSLQVDGNVAVTANIRSAYASHGYFQIGRRTAKTGYVHAFHGSVADLRVYNRLAYSSEQGSGFVRQLTRLGYWPLNEVTGTTTVTTKGYGADGSVEARKALTLNGNVGLKTPPAPPVPCDEGPECDFVPDPPEFMGNLNPYFGFDGAGDWLSTTEHVIGLKGSYTVAVRARLVAACSGAASGQVVLSQPGVHRSRFQVRCEENKWTLVTADADSGTGVKTTVDDVRLALPYADDPNGQHLAVTYNETTGEIILYVDGQFAASGKGTQPNKWNATVNAGLQVGRALGATTIDQWGGYFSGDLDEIRTYSGVLPPAEVAIIGGITVVPDK